VRDDIVFEEKDAPLRADVNRLGAVVGDMVREQEGEALFDRVEAARQAAIARRAGEPGAEAALDAALGGRDPGEATALVRAFATYFRVVNRAEQIHRIRRRRDYDRDPATAPPGSLRAALEALREAGVGPGAVAEALGRVVIEPVLTAHPTEATRRTILQKEQRIARLLLRLDDPTQTPVERAMLEARIRMEVTAAWQTATHAAARPTVENEREHVLYYLLSTLYEVVPALHEALGAAVAAVFGDRVAVPDRPPVRFGSWVGGDMDGNPAVSAETIRSTLAAHRDAILARYRAEAGQLAAALTQSTSRVPAADGVLGRVAEYGRRFPDALAAVPPRHREMPYRVLCRLLQARLDATLARTGDGYAGPGELEADLEAIAASLAAHRGAHAGLFLVERALRRVRTFGFHLATLDVRQDARVLREAVAAMLGRDDWPGLPPAARLEALRDPGVLGEPAAEGLADVAREALAVFRAIAGCRAEHGPGAVGPYIISMAGGADDVVAVLRLAAAAGLRDPSGVVPLDVAPLFETVEDLGAAPGTMARLWDEAGYREHLTARAGGQVVMIGYSDSAKDGGIVASRWALHQAQADLAALAAERGVGLTLFHGRGGTVARGGSPPHRAVLAAPAGAVAGRFRLTEQGESIDARYGLRGIAFRTLERLTGAVLQATARPQRPAPPPAWPAMMETFTRESRRAWRALVYERPAFPTYFREATPIDVIERMAIGSRPASRRQGEGLEHLRAIPWVFAWTQSRHMLPGWYGAGAGLAALVDAHGLAEVARVAAEWPFLGTLLDDVETGLAKADLGVAARYAALSPAAGEEVFPVIRAEFDRAADLVLRLRGAGELLERDPTLRRAIRLRNPYVDPMSFLQIDLLAAWRAGGRADDRLLEALLETVNGIAQGLQSTG
jgi:phosphoenolpyruvate carboxylase